MQRHQVLQSSEGTGLYKHRFLISGMGRNFFSQVDSLFLWFAYVFSSVSVGVYIHFCLRTVVFILLIPFSLGDCS